MRKVLFIVLVWFIWALGQAQESVSVVSGFDTFETLQDKVPGDIIQTSALVCTDQATLTAVLDVLSARAAADEEPVLSDELTAEVDANCFLDDQVELEYVALGSEPMTLSFPLENGEFAQDNTIKLVEVKVSGYAIDKLYTLAGSRVALKGSLSDYQQSAYFAVLESIKIAKQ
ncbi:MAG: hypothetical protein KC422_06325 [Trueperaceae bacterium]|nr:hypothetical protein [Trueperaceae bacterium]